MDKLDLKDRKILYELDLNARQPDSEIAKTVGLSRDAVSYRIKNLIDAGYIKYFYTILNTMKLGYDFYRTLFKFQNLTLEKEKEIIDWLLPKVSYIVKAEGQWDLSTSIFVKNVYEYRTFINEFLMKYSDYVDGYDVAIMTRLWNYHRDYLVGPGREGIKYEVMGFDENQEPELVKIDKTDYKILYVMLKEARMRTIDIAKRVGVSETVVRYRIRNLIDNGVILGFRSLLDARKLGYLYYKAHLTLHNLSIEKKKKILSYIHQYPNAIYSIELVGGSDIEMHIEVESVDGLDRYINDMRSNFGDIIKSYYIMEYKGELKWAYLPDMSFKPQG